MSRTEARGKIDGKIVKSELEKRGIAIYETHEKYLSEEAPDAYKDVDDVIELTKRAGLARPVARLKPLIVIKDKNLFLDSIFVELPPILSIYFYPTWGKGSI